MDQFYCHKYRPYLKDDFLFHQELAGRLECFAQHKNLIHMVFYGPFGSGKYTLALSLVYHLLQGVADRECVFNTKQATLVCNETEVIIHQSKYHFELDSLDYGYCDKKVFNNFILEISNSMNVVHHCYKLIIIKNTDVLSLDAQYTLRRTMETHYRSCRIIFLTHNLSSMDEAIKSRCLLFRVPLPTEVEIGNLLDRVAEGEQLSINKAKRKEIIQRSERNAHKLLLYLQYYVLQPEEPLEKLDIVRNIIQSIVNNLGKLDPKTIMDQRQAVYKLLLLECTPVEIFRYTILFVVKRVSYRIKHNQFKKILKAASENLSNIRTGYRAIFHVETFLITVANIIQKNNTDSEVSLLREIEGESCPSDVLGS